MSKSEFVAYIVELLSAHGDIKARAMFGGHGVYCNGLFVAIIVQDVLFFKANETTKAEFIKEGSKPFEFDGRRGHKVSMSYYEVPSDAIDSSEGVAPWLALAMKAAAASPAAKKKAPKKSGPSVGRR